MRGIQGAVLISSILPILIGFLGIWRIFARYIYIYICSLKLSQNFHTFSLCLFKVLSYIGVIMQVT